MSAHSSMVGPSGSFNWIALRSEGGATVSIPEPWIARGFGVHLFQAASAYFSGVITTSVLPIFARKFSPVPMCSFTRRDGV
jgi:hypothetical protein